MRAALVRLGWRLLAALSERGSRLPALAAVLLVLGLPALPRSGSAPAVSPAPAPAPPAPAVASIDEILALKAPTLGLEVRQQLAAALVEESTRAHLDPLLVLAVMRVESEFDEDATSVRGARGLMQLRPGTLAFLAQREGLRLPAEEIQQDPVLSTRLAVRYLGALMKSFHGDVDRALMAYNAGPHRLHVAVKARDTERLDRLASYPRRVHHAYRRLQALTPNDALAETEHESALHLADGE